MSISDKRRTTNVILISAATVIALIVFGMLVDMSLNLHKATMIADGKQQFCGESYMEAETARFAAYEYYERKHVHATMQIITDSVLIPIICVVYGWMCFYIIHAIWYGEYDFTWLHFVCLLLINYAAYVLSSWMKNDVIHSSKIDDILICGICTIVICICMLKGWAPSNVRLGVAVAMTMTLLLLLIILRQRSNFMYLDNKYAPETLFNVKLPQKQVLITAISCIILLAVLAGSCYVKALDVSTGVLYAVLVVFVSSLLAINNLYRNRIGMLLRDTDSKVYDKEGDMDNYIAPYGYIIKKLNALLASGDNKNYYLNNLKLIQLPPYPSKVSKKQLYKYVLYSKLPSFIREDEEQDGEFADYKHSLDKITPLIKNETTIFMQCMLGLLIVVLGIPLYLILHSFNSQSILLVALVLFIIGLLFVSSMGYGLTGGLFV